MTVVYPTADIDRVWADHKLAIAGLLSDWWAKNIAFWGSSAKQGYLAGARAGIQYVLDLQHQVDAMPAGELLTELRKGDGSIYWPLFSADPKFWTVCPRCHVAIKVDVDGVCENCTHEIQEDD